MPRTDVYPSAVTHSRHPLVRELRRLHEREERDRRGRFLIDGIRFVAQAVERNARFERVITCKEWLTPHGRSLAARIRRGGVPVHDLSPAAYRAFTLAAEPQGLAAVMHKDWMPLWHARPDPGDYWLAVSTVQSPGNLGTMLRTADAAGARGLICLEGAADPWDPAVVRASMGAFFTQELVLASALELRAWKQRHGCRIVGTSPSGALAYREVDYSGPVVLFMGWERQGLSEAEEELCDLMVRIPMRGRSDSLNVSVAAGVLLYEVLEQRMRNGEAPADTAGRVNSRLHTA